MIGPVKLKLLRLVGLGIDFDCDSGATSKEKLVLLIVFFPVQLVGQTNVLNKNIMLDPNR